MKVEECNYWVVNYQGYSSWFETREDAEDFMRKVEDSLLFQ